ncbi:MAG: hypothetical protein HYU36_17510 [Planctomycetes bacterium]|nr:hypothetical protein [Planctomycetota bacterium]
MSITHFGRTVARTAVVMSLVWYGQGALASGGEHPEQPKDGKEHPEHPKGKKEASVSLEDVAAFIESYVQKNSKEGAFSVMDNVAKKKLSLTLDKVHRERLSQIGKDTFFVCADFKTADGQKVYDLDFFVAGTKKENLKVLAEKTSVHKEDGTPRYNWEEEGGMWKKKDNKAEKPAKKEHEHPEHPK